MTITRHLSLLSVAACLYSTATPAQASGVQSGPSAGNAFAGGMFYDANNHLLYVSGQAYFTSFFSTTNTDSSQCFVASLDLNDWDFNDAAAVLTSSGTGTSSSTTTCQAIGFLAPSTFVVGGNSESGGLAFSGNEPMQGFALLVDRNDISSPLDSLAFRPTASGRIEYPQFLVTVKSSSSIYSISLTSVDTTENTADDYDQPNYMDQVKYGSSFDMTVRKLSLQQEEFLGVPTGPITLQDAWWHEFPVDDAGSGTPPRVFVGGVMVKNDRMLVVAGSTRGLGIAYGNAEGNDEDGFVTLLDLSSGELLALESGQERNNVRIGTAQNDVVMGICDDPQDTNSFYIVGATAGVMDDSDAYSSQPLKAPSGSLQAFVSKLDIATLNVQWSRQWGARMSPDDSTSITGAFASGCSVVGNTLYVAGGVEDGAGMIWLDSILTNQGQDDLWVVSLNTNDADMNWMKQIGSDGNDELSRHGGVAADRDGNAILYGHTDGSLYRTRGSFEEGTDVFVIILDAAEGDHAPLGQPVAAPTDAPVEPTLAPEPLETLPPKDFTAIGDQLSGPLFAGGLVYDARMNQAWFTGATFADGDSKCFVASLDLESGRIVAPSEFGKAGTNEACSAIEYSQLEDLIYVVGGTQQDGFLVANSQVNIQDGNTNDDAVQFGLLMQIQADNSHMSGGVVLQEDIVQYPVKAISQAEDDVVFVVSMGSDSGQTYSIPQSETPNYTAGGIRPYGDNFYTVIQRYRVTSTQDRDQVTKVFDEEFYQRYGVDEENENVYTSGMTLAGNGNTLIVVGSTRGTGGPFGNENLNGDMDGFLIKLDPLTGQLQEVPGHRSSTRLDSIDQKDDWVTNVCNDMYDQDAVYVVGASQGKVRDLSDDQQPAQGTTHAFVAKILIESLTAEWLQHFTMQVGNDGGPAQASAFGCAVTADGLVYIAGGIEGGATLDNADKTPGADGDDIFVAQMVGADGTVNWIQQVGTSEKERLAHGGGIDVDADGNAIVYAETAGSFYANHAGNNGDMDLVVFTMDKRDGSYKTLVQNGGDVLPPTAAPEPGGPADEPAFNPEAINALQTGPDVGPTYAGGMYYDIFSNTIYVTGATYGTFGKYDGSDDQASPVSSCIFGSLILPELAWREKEVYGTANAPEACNALAMTTYNDKSAAIVIGSTEAGGLLTELGTSGIPAKQYGFAMDLASVDGRFVLQGGAAMDQTGVQFPVAVETNDQGIAWIASMISDDTMVNPSYDMVSTDEYPNLTTGGIEKYGSKYRIVMERYQLIRSGASEEDHVLESSLQRQWRKPFETPGQESIFLSDMVMVQGGKSLIVVGSTKGSKNTDMDGIMAKIDPDTGTFQTGGRKDRSVAYFASVTDRDDWILGACPDPDDSMSFYVVGATQGRMDSDTDRDRKDVTVHAVVAKIHVDSLTAAWTKQFSVTHAHGTDSKPAAASAFSCDVVPGQNVIYIAGTVENGATMDNYDQKSAGRDDIFVAKLWTKGGAVAWLKQVGSNGDDRIARGGGVKADANGNAVVFGDTNGSFFRERTGDGPTDTYSDLFMMIFDKVSGDHTIPIVAAPVLPDDTSTPTEWYPNGVSQDNTTVKMLSFAIIALALLMCGVCILCIGRRHARKRAEAQKTSIFAYLQQFDVEDIDLRKSPPGGWHGTYLHKLAYGINKAGTNSSNGRLPDVEPSPHETAPLTHSSVVRDSLFMDTTSAPSLGYRDDPELHGLDLGYDDLKPRSYEDRARNLKEVI